jgi:hypothetical protein
MAESVRSLQARGFRPGRNECPTCGGEKGILAKQCWACHYGLDAEGRAALKREQEEKRKRLEQGDVPYALCGGKPLSKAKRDTGHTCLRPAGWRTPHYGVGRCYFHGGMQQSHLIHGAKVLATIAMMDAEAAEAKKAERKKCRFKAELVADRKRRRTQKAR